jgi:putative acetyltransferase
MLIRPADPDDAEAIDALLRSAFDGAEEAMIVKALRAAEADTLELVAERDDQIIGTVMFSPVTTALPDGSELFGLGLGPLAVADAARRQGVGAALTEAGLAFITTLGVPWCVVLGDPTYYARFGFKPASDAGWAWDGDPDGQYKPAFQRLLLSAGALQTGTASVSYHPAFALDQKEGAGDA